MRRRRFLLPATIQKIVEWDFDVNGMVVCRKITFRLAKNDRSW